MQSPLSLKGLNTFAAAAETLSFQDAAQRLHVTPSAVSHQIRSLEDVLGYALFERGDRSIALTRRGEELYMGVRSPLRQLHDAGRAALRRSVDNTLAVSVVPGFATRWLLPRLQDFHAHHPEVNLSVVADTAVVDLLASPFDAAIRRGRAPWPGLSAELLFPLSTVAVCRPGLVQKRGSLFSPDELADQALVHLLHLPRLWNDWLHTAGVDRSEDLPGLRVQDWAQSLEAVASSDAVGLVDLSLVNDDLESGRLALACEHVMTGPEGFFLVWPGERGDSPSAGTALGALHSWLLEQAGRAV
ncbi:MAG: LysR substrate-binding domain-containing protein [Gammaproteobacteria bacterium]